MRPVACFIGVALALALASRTSHADCNYTGRDYYHLDDWEGACFAEPSVPLGCPVGVVVPKGATVTPVVTRGLAVVQLPADATLVDTVTEGVSSIDVIACDCPPTQLEVVFDRYEVAVTGAQAGDIVTLADTVTAQQSWTTFDAAAPCPAVVWPTGFGVSTACDLCPIGSDGSGDDPGDPATAHHSSGCAAGGGGASMLAMGVVAGALVRRRRRPR